jgi:hypothetical protein
MQVYYSRQRQLFSAFTLHREDCIENIAQSRAQGTERREARETKHRVSSSGRTRAATGHAKAKQGSLTAAARVGVTAGDAV